MDLWLDLAQQTLYAIYSAQFFLNFIPYFSAIGLSWLSYNEKLKIAVVFDHSVLPSTIPWKELIKSVTDNLRVLNASEFALI